MSKHLQVAEPRTELDRKQVTMSRVLRETSAASASVAVCTLHRPLLPHPCRSHRNSRGILSTYKPCQASLICYIATTTSTLPTNIQVLLCHTLQNKSQTTLNLPPYPRSHRDHMSPSFPFSAPRHFHTTGGLPCLP